MKTQEELNKLKNEYKDLNKKLAELSEDELKQVTGGKADDPSGYQISERMRATRQR